MIADKGAPLKGMDLTEDDATTMIMAARLKAGWITPEDLKAAEQAAEQAAAAMAAAGVDEETIAEVRSEIERQEQASEAAESAPLDA